MRRLYAEVRSLTAGARWILAVLILDAVLFLALLAGWARLLLS